MKDRDYKDVENFIEALDYFDDDKIIRMCLSYEPFHDSMSKYVYFQKGINGIDTENEFLELLNKKYTLIDLLDNNWSVEIEEKRDNGYPTDTSNSILDDFLRKCRCNIKHAYI